MSEPFIAEIRIFAGNFAPRGWALCDGQILSITQNTALFSLLGTTYGGNGQSTFGLPDLQGRSPMHPGAGPGLTPRRLGEADGAAQVALNPQELPTHTHLLAAVTAQGDDDRPAGRVLAQSGALTPYAASASNTTMAAATLESVGSGAAHDNMQPWLAVTFIIALVGNFPQRP